MIKKLTTITMAAAMVLSFNSCKKYGCTNSTATNHSTVANKDDGSCIYPVVVEPTQIVFENKFSMTFGPTVAYNSYTPSFKYETGDVVILENLTDPTYNYWSPMPIVTTGVVVWGEYGEANGEIYVYTDNASTGNDYFFSSTVTLGFRAMLIKKSALIANPNLKDMTIDQVKAML